MVYLYDIGILGELVQYHAHNSVIKYNIDGVEYITAMLNEDFEIIQELGLGMDDYE